MEDVNQTRVNHFIILGFSNLQNFRVYLSLAILLVYILTISGNFLIILLARMDPSLDTPMYFFISNLSFLEIWYISTTVPKLLAILMSRSQIISFKACFVQLYIFHSLGLTECSLLAVMALDRYLAICNPLRYTIIMSGRLCVRLAALCWTAGFLAAIIPTTMAVRLPFCGPNYINHYFCDLSPLLSLACTNTFLNGVVNGSVIGFATMFNFLIIIIIYVHIISAVLKIKTAEGRGKAFSTCSSHLTVVVLFYGTAFTVYVSPKGNHSMEYDKLFALVYTILTPMLNPIIYSLRNKEVKEALIRATRKIPSYISQRN
ncbi:olfactory receptor 6N1-like [Rhinatrema bivittatum]|uniref:olfactory receptor 6N1-like n=1 Tax=Rhinatrema bivittatum TaxID=194408 RepID=UPI00112C0F27|nr:olfactory receptor 6N1-like [Rhinatrema bivittatum]